jgi:hypothetical protein
MIRRELRPIGPLPPSSDSAMFVGLQCVGHWLNELPKAGNFFDESFGASNFVSESLKFYEGSPNSG